uniref:Uncharacterized protein n=1 Tax=viral metagenome TaxID=1070528 RepID=A0A6H1ZZS1_9ZZZZ
MGGVFEEGGGYPDSANGIERCKRDYEAEIAKGRQGLEVTAKLRKALDEYLEIHGHYGRETFTLPALYGSLALSERQIEKTIFQIQEAWENDK